MPTDVVAYDSETGTMICHQPAHRSKGKKPSREGAGDASWAMNMASFLFALQQNAARAVRQPSACPLPLRYFSLPSGLCCSFVTPTHFPRVTVAVIHDPGRRRIFFDKGAPADPLSGQSAAKRHVGGKEKSATADADQNAKSACKLTAELLKGVKEMNRTGIMRLISATSSSTTKLSGKGEEVREASFPNNVDVDGDDGDATGTATAAFVTTTNTATATSRKCRFDGGSGGSGINGKEDGRGPVRSEGVSSYVVVLAFAFVAKVKSFMFYRTDKVEPTA